MSVKRQFYKVSEVAEMMGLSKITILQRIESGRIKAIKNDGKNGQYLIPVEEYERYIQSLGV